MNQFNNLSEMLEHIKDKLVAQGEPCNTLVNGSAACVYFNSKGNRCAAGHVMDKDEAIKQFGNVEDVVVALEMNNVSLTQLLVGKIIQPIPGVPDGILLDALAMSQNIHDTLAIESWPQAYEQLITRFKQKGYE